MNLRTSAALVAVLAAVFGVLAPESKPNPIEAARLNNLGVAYMNQQLFEKGLKSFQQASQADPKLTIARLNAYQEAGADVLYAPGLSTQSDIADVVRSVDPPVNVVMGLQGASLSLSALATIGVKRVSVGGSLCRTAFTALIRAGREMQTLGTFTYAKDAVTHREMNELFALGSQ